jgi:protein TonB
VTSLAYRASPLRFPAQAIRAHMEGTVLLLVLVDEHGKPVQVKVEQSSGYPLLDKSAREQVLSAWQFQPAVIDGHAVKAWARVPVSFALQQL